MKKALSHFKKSDPIFFEVAKKINLPEIERPDDPFLDLIDSIISQQLSGKAAATIFSRFKKLFPNEKITPTQILKLDDNTIRECGISFGKTSYIKGIANEIKYNRLNLKSLEILSDEEVIFELTKIKGIGIWTAEMYLMFTLGRNDIFSTGDLGLQNAMIKIYDLDKKPKKEILLEISNKWSPYRTTASRILWKSLDS